MSSFLIYIISITLIFPKLFLAMRRGQSFHLGAPLWTNKNGLTPRDLEISRNMFQRAFCPYDDAYDNYDLHSKNLKTKSVPKNEMLITM